jgi:hypothetical protein
MVREKIQSRFQRFIFMHSPDSTVAIQKVAQSKHIDDANEREKLMLEPI